MIKKLGDFDQTPKKIGDLRAGDNFSFYTPKKKRNEDLQDLCEVHIPDVPNLDIIKKVGRQTGDNIIYSPDQTYNYLSPSSRYDAGLQISPDSIIQDGDKIIYKFCSSNSPTGYWDVILSPSGKATYLKFSKNPLYIICPQPFRLSQLTKLLTDSKTVSWMQIEGNRNVVVEPNNSFDPIINILESCDGNGCDYGSLSPLIFRVETDNYLIFNDLIIQNRLIDNYYGGGYAARNNLGLSCQIIDIAASIKTAPIYTQKAYLWQGEPLRIYWLPPSCDSQFVTDYQINVLIPPYQPYLQISANNRFAMVEPNKQYRLLTNFLFNTKPYTSTSDVFQFFYEPPNSEDILGNKVIFADETANIKLGYAASKPKYTKLNYGVKSFSYSDAAQKYLGFVKSKDIYSKVSYGVKIVDNSEVANIRLGYAASKSKYTKVNLGGIVIG